MKISKSKIIARLNRVILYFSVVILMFFTLFPLYWAILASLSQKNVLYSATPNFIPHDIVWENYNYVIFHSNVLRSIGNSLFVATLTTIICITLGTFSAYAFARLRFRGSGIAFYSLIITEMIPPIALIIAFFLLFKQLNMLNNLFILVIIHSSWLLPMSTWILFSYFKTIPTELEDSARVDGATRIGSIFKIIIPLSTPGIVSAAVVSFLLSLGEFLSAITIINKQELFTLPQALVAFIGKTEIHWGRMTAGAVKE